jgi:hypothetical protein
MLHETKVQPFTSKLGLLKFFLKHLLKGEDTRNILAAVTTEESVTTIIELKNLLLRA